MTIQELFIRSNQELKQSISQIRPEHMAMEMPYGMSTKPATLSEAIKSHSYDDAWVPDVLAGKTKDQVGDKYEGVLATEDSNLINVYNEYNVIASEAVRSFDNLDNVAHLSYGDFTAREYLQHTTVFRAFRSHDIAQMIGANAAMSEDFAQALWDEFAAFIDGYRQMGIFPPVLEVPESSNIQTKLLALAGRPA